MNNNQYGILLNIRMKQELANTFMLIDDEKTKSWYDFAIKSLNFASPISLQITQEEYTQLLDREDDGAINYNTVASLCNSLEARNANEMGVGFREFADMIKLNSEAVKNWQKNVAKVQPKIEEEVRLKLSLSDKTPVIGMNKRR